MRRTSSGFLLLAILASFSLFVGLTAQAQNSRPVLITQNVDESKLVTLAGNTGRRRTSKTIAGWSLTTLRWITCCSS